MGDVEAEVEKPVVENPEEPVDEGKKKPPAKKRRLEKSVGCKIVEVNLSPKSHDSRTLLLHFSFGILIFRITEGVLYFNNQEVISLWKEEESKSTNMWKISIYLHGDQKKSSYFMTTAEFESLCSALVNNMNTEA